MNAAEVFSQMAEEFQPDRAGSLRATFQFILSGEEGGSWLVTVANRTCTVTQEEAKAPDVTIKMAADDFVKMVTGELQPMTAFMQGKIRLKGDMTLAMKVQDLFSGPGG